MSYAGRRLPFVVEFGEYAAPSPLSVSHLSDGFIVLTGGRQISGQPEIRQEIAFADDGRCWENADLYCKLIDLNTRGLPFQHRPKEMESPDGLMAWWQEIGKLSVSYREISWRSQNEWYMTTIEPPVIGVLGWTGPKPFGS